MIKYIQAKTILATVKQSPDNIFGAYYNMNLYRGCQHQCIYCDSRSKCYQIENFADIHIKENAIELLTKEFASKRVHGTVGTGSMNDPYMPIEADICLTRKALELLKRFHFPVHIITKGSLVCRDIDILLSINKLYAAVSFTITTADDKLSRIIEPNASLSSERFDAIKQLSNAGIYTGITLMPVLPFITDSIENVESIVRKGKEAGAKYILAYFGTTQREGQREYFYRELDKNFIGIKEKYMAAFGNNYICSSNNYMQLYQYFMALCSKYSIQTKMEFYKIKINQQNTLF